MMVARLSASPGERPMWVATVDPLRRSIGMVPAEAARPDPRTRELWLIPADGRPRALGVFDPAHAVSMPMPDNLLGQAAPQVVLAVSLEPPGGSPTGKPSGPVIAKGELSAV
jgi:anti-sigma-K factor RskA